MKTPPRVSSSFSVITFDDFHIFGKFLHFTLTVLCVLSRRLLILRARHSFKVSIARRGRCFVSEVGPPVLMGPRGPGPHSASEYAVFDFVSCCLYLCLCCFRCCLFLSVLLLVCVFVCLFRVCVCCLC